MIKRRNRSSLSAPGVKNPFIFGICVAAVLALGSSELHADADNIRSLKELEQYSGPFNRNLELHNLLSNSNEQQLLELLEESKEVDRQKRPQLQSPILQRLSQFDPKRAFAQIEQLAEDSPEQLIAAVFAEWSSSNLEEAIVFASSLDEDSRFAALKSILAERTDLAEDERLDVARQLGNERYAVNLNLQKMLSKPIDNPEKTWNELIDEIQDDPGQFWALATVARAWVEKSGFRILDRVSRSLTNDQTRQFVLDSVLRQLAESDPEGAFEYALKLDSSPGSSGSLDSGVLDTWVKSDPRSALEAASQVEQLGLRRRLQDFVVRAWAYEMPRDVLSSLNAIPEHLHSSATRAAIGEWVQEDPNEVADFVARMDSQSRTLAGSNLVASWASGTGYEAALDWLLTEPRVADLKSLLLPETLMYLVYRGDPELAMKTALEQPISGDKTGLEASLIFYIATKNPDEALEFLPQVRSGATKLAAVGHLGKIYLENDASDEAVSLAKQLPASKQTEYIQSLMATWTRRDPADLLDSLDQLPTADVKSKAAVALIEYDKRNSVLSEQQAQKARRYLSARDAEGL